MSVFASTLSRSLSDIIFHIPDGNDNLFIINYGDVTEHDLCRFFVDVPSLPFFLGGWVWLHVGYFLLGLFLLKGTKLSKTIFAYLKNLFSLFLHSSFRFLDSGFCFQIPDFRFWVPVLGFRVAPFLTVCLLYIQFTLHMAVIRHRQTYKFAFKNKLQ